MIRRYLTEGSNGSRATVHFPIVDLKLRKLSPTFITRKCTTRKRVFLEEYKIMLREFEVDYNEQFIFKELE